MKTVIVQSLFGGGVAGDDHNERVCSHHITKYCLPSVQKYADRHGYGYILHRPTQLHFCMTKTDVTEHFTKELSSREFSVTITKGQFNSFFEPFYVMNELSSLYERFIYLDLDIYINPDAPAMPHEKGVWAYHEAHVPHSYNVGRGFSEVPHSHQFNSGVLVMDRKGVKSFYDYLCHVKPDSRCTSDQDYFRLWSLKNKVNKMSAEWNYMVFKGNKEKRGHVIHYIDKSRMQWELPPFHIRMWNVCYDAIKTPERLLRRLLRRWRKGGGVV